MSNRARPEPLWNGPRIRLLISEGEDLEVSGTQSIIRSPCVVPQSSFALFTCLLRTPALRCPSEKTSGLAVGIPMDCATRSLMQSRHLVLLTFPAWLRAASGRRTIRGRYPEVDADSCLHLLPVPQRLSCSRSLPAATACRATATPYHHLKPCSV